MSNSNFVLVNIQKLKANIAIDMYLFEWAKLMLIAH
jgi:hypothetical protein